MVDLKVNLSGITLDNPIIPASGTFGYGMEYKDLYDINMLGSISFKGTTVHERFGNPGNRVAECKAGMINAVGLQNPGLEAVIDKEIPRLAQYFKKPLIANISGGCTEDYIACAEAMDKVGEVGIIEVNISCPNVKGGGMAFGQVPEVAAEVTRAVKAVASKPVYMKLSPNVTSIVDIAKACEEAGADGLSLINTLVGMRIDIKTGKPIIGVRTGGYSGPGIFPIALAMVNQVYNAVNIPIIGMGGIETAEDVIEMIMAGASAVQIGAANLVNPWVCKEIIEELPNVMERLGINNFEEIRGLASKGL